MSTAAAVRVCSEHDQVAIVDDVRDRVICPGVGEAKEHRLKPGQWTVRTPGAVLGGDYLVMARARATLAAAKGDQASATAALVEEARLNPRLLGALLEDAAGRAITRASGREVLGGEMLSRGPAPVGSRATAAPTSRPTPTPRSDRDRGLECLAATNLRDLLDEEIRPGVALRDAKVDQVLEAAAEAAGQARDGAVRARWLRLIARRLSLGHRVGQVLVEGVVQSLHAQAERDLSTFLGGLTKRIATTREHQLEDGE